MINVGIQLSNGGVRWLTNSLLNPSILSIIHHRISSPIRLPEKWCQIIIRFWFIGKNVSGSLNADVDHTQPYCCYFTKTPNEKSTLHVFLFVATQLCRCPHRIWWHINRFAHQHSQHAAKILFEYKILNTQLIWRIRRWLNKDKIPSSCTKSTNRQPESILSHPFDRRNGKIIQ